MKKITFSISKFKEFIINHLLAVFVSSFLLLYSSIKRFNLHLIIFEKIKISGSNIVSYFVSIFTEDYSIGNQILDLLKLKVESGQLNSIIPESVTDFISRFTYSFKVMFAKGYVYSELMKFGYSIRNLSILLTLSIFFIPLIIIIIDLYFKEEPYYVEKISPSVSNWNKFYEKYVFPIIEFIKRRINSVLDKRYFKISLIISSLIYFNVANIGTDFFTYYFAFLTTFEFELLWEMIYVMFVDLTPVLVELPMWFYISVVYYLFCRFRKKLAIDILNHHEAINCGFMKGSGVMLMLNGAPGCGKTKTMTDMSLSVEMMFRQEAKGIMDEVRNIFPNFRWDILRKYLDLNIRMGNIKSLDDVEQYIINDFIERIEMSFKYNPSHYFNFKKYKSYFNNHLKYETLFEDIIDYAKGYFIYQSDFSLILSNYPIRAEHVNCGTDHMVKWNYNYFVDQCSEIVPEGYSKVVDYDMLRLIKSKNIDNDNRKISIAYVISLTELGKERGNTLENAEMKKSAPEANAKNDGLTDMLRVARHPATIRHRTFIKILFDEQRSSSCGVALSGITEDILTIDKKKTKTKNSMYFFFIRLLIIRIGCKLSSWFLSKHEEVRNDITIPLLFFSWLSKLSTGAYLNYFNNYTYDVISFYLDNGSLQEIGSSETRSQKYYLAYKKIYSERYSSDYLRTFFDLKSRSSKKGISDLPHYEDLYPSFEEINYQQSYFGDSLKKNLIQHDEESQNSTLNIL
jgi:hypothetical protein